MMFFPCTFCGKKFRSIEHLDKHQSTYCTKARESSKEIKKPNFSNPENKTVLVKCGKSFIDPQDVASIRSVKDGTLFIVKLKSDPNPEFPLWAEPNDVTILLSYFKIVE